MRRTTIRTTKSSQARRVNKRNWPGKAGQVAPMLEAGGVGEAGWAELDGKAKLDNPIWANKTNGKRKQQVWNYPKANLSDNPWLIANWSEMTKITEIQPTSHLRRHQMTFQNTRFLFLLGSLETDTVVEIYNLAKMIEEDVA